MALSLLFFFSSRRRHTRCSRDWSSDVCSSDLYLQDTTSFVGIDRGIVDQHVRTPKTCLQRLLQLLHAHGICDRSEEHTSELQSRLHLVCRLLLEKKKKKQ